MNVTRRGAFGAAGLALASPGLLAGRGSLAQGATPPPQGSLFHKFRVGSLNVTIVNDGAVTRPLQTSLPPTFNSARGLPRFSRRSARACPSGWILRS